MPVAYLASGISDWLAGGLSEQTQPTTRLACSNGHGCYRLGNDCIQFKLSRKPGVAAMASIAEGDSIINATLLYYRDIENMLIHLRYMIISLECIEKYVTSNRNIGLNNVY